MLSRSSVLWADATHHTTDAGKAALGKIIVAEAHVGSHPDTLEELTVGFSGALLLQMKRIQENRVKLFGNRDAYPEVRTVSSSNRRRVLEAIGRYLEMVKPVH